MTASPRRQLLARTALCGALAAIAVSATPVAALDYGSGVVSSGSNTGSITGSTTGGVTTINVGGSRGFINWNSFNLANGETVNFQFNNRNDLVVNRVLSGSTAVVDGVLNGCLGVCDGSNYGGNIWLLSAGGALITNNARINTGGFLVSTAGLTDADILDGDNNFSFSGLEAGAIDILSGARVTGHGGALAFVAPVVRTSGGSSVTGLNGSDVFYGSAAQYNVTFAQTATDDLDLVTFQVPTGGGAAGGSPGLFLNGATTANQVYAAAVSKSGVAANILLGGSITATTAASENGAIVLSSGGGITNGVADAPVSDAASIAQAMGSVLTADTISLRASNSITMGGAATGTLNLDAGGAIALNDVNVAKLGRVSAGTSFTYSSASTATLQLTDDIMAGGAVSLIHGGDVDQTGGAITAAGLTIDAHSVNATGANSITGETHLTGDYVNFNATGDLTLQINATNIASITSGGKVTFGGGNSAGGMLNVTAAAGIAQASTGLFGLDYATFGQLISNLGGINLTNTGSINLAGDVTAVSQSIRLNSANGSIIQTGGVITGSSFGGSAATGIDLSRINRVSSLSGLDAGTGALTFRNYGSFSMNGAYRSGSAAGTLMSLRSDTGLINQIGGLIQAHTFEAYGGLGMSLDRSNAITTVKSLTSLANNGITLRTDGNMVLTGDVTAVGQRVRLLTNGSLTQTGGVITAGTLRGTVSAGVSLTGANQIDAIENFSVSSGATTIRNAKSLVIQGSVTSMGTGGSIDIATTAGTLTGTGGIATSQSLTLTGADGVNLTGIMQGNASVTIEALNGDTVVSNAESNGLITIKALAGNATLRASNLTGSTGAINIRAGATATLGADSLAGITVANFLTRTAGAGQVNVVSDGGDARVFLNSLNTVLTLVDAGSNGTASIGVANGFSVNTVTGSNVSLSAAGGTINAANVTIEGGDYTLVGRDFSGAGVFTPAGTVRNLSITDTQGGLVLNNALSAQGTLSIVVQDGSLSATQNLVAGGDLTLSAGSVISATNLTASGSLDVSAAGNVTIQTATAGDDMRLVSNGGSLIVRNINMTGAGPGHDLTVRASTELTMGADAPILGSGGPQFQRAGTGSTTIESTSGSAKIHFNASTSTITRLGDVTANAVSIAITAGVVELNNVTARTGSVAIQGGAAQVTVAGTINTALNLLVNTYSLNLLSVVAGADVSIMTQHDLAVGSATAGDDISIISASGSTTVRSATLTGAGVDVDGYGYNLEIGSGSGTTFGADNEAGITSANAFTRLSGTGSASISSMTGPVNVYLANAASFTSLSAGGMFPTPPRALNAVVATGNLTIGNVYAGSASLKAGGTLSVGGISGLNGNYAVTAADFGGVALAPTGTLNDVTIVDTAGGLTLFSPIFANGLLTIDSSGALLIGGALYGAGGVRVESHGGLTVAAGASLTSTTTGDAIVLASDGVFTNNAGASALNAANGRWLVYTQATGQPASTGADNFGGLVAKNFYGSTYDFATNSFSTAPNAGNRIVYGYRPTLTVTPVGQTVTYNGAIPTVSALITGLVNGDLASDAWSGSPLISGATSKNVGAYTLLASLGTLASDLNYDFAFGTGLLTINPKTLTGVFTANDKTYDGSDTATGSITLAGVIGTDDVSAGGTYRFGDKTAGAGKTVTASGVSLSGEDAGNYVLDPLATAIADILRKDLTGLLVVDNKTYDGTTAANGSISLAGIVGSDEVSASGSYAFGDRNAGTGKTIIVSGLGLTGADAQNYNLLPLAAAVADILRKDLTGLLTAQNKTYDGTDTATGSISLTGIVGDDEVTAGGSYSFGDKNAGTGKIVTANGVTLSGADAQNYNLLPLATALADILRKDLSGLLTAQTKTYDGTTNATGSISLTGVVGDDDVTAGGSYSFGDKNAGTGKVVTASGVTLTGADADNYNLLPLATALADILRKDLTGLITAQNKTYDGTTTATGSISLTGVVGDDDVTAGGSYSFGDKNAGTGKVVTSSSVTLTGADADNYNLLPLATALADILRKDLTGLLTAQNKTYDGTTTANGSISLTGVVGDDDVTVGGSYSFGDKNAGTGKVVTAHGVTLSGADAQNYNLLPLATALADILRKDIAGLLTAQTKTYDGTTTATGSISLTGVLTGDEVAAGGSYSFGDKNAGTGKVVTASGVTLTGADAQNYNLEPLATALADILRKSITGAVVADDKTYDGSVTAGGSLTLTGVIVGDQVSASGAYAFADRNAGVGKTVTASNVLLAGADAGNYELGAISADQADILRRQVTVAADDLSKRFGQSDPTLTWRIASGSLVEGDAVAGGLVRELGEDAGTYLIAQGSLSLSSNYDLTFTPGSFVIQASQPTEGWVDGQRQLLSAWKPSLETDRSSRLTIIDERDEEDETP